MTEVSQNSLVEGLQHIITYDSKGKQMDGGKQYKINLPPDIPASDFWSIIVYDPMNRLIIHTDQPWPSVYSNNRNLVYNTDGSIDVWFSPKTLEAKEINWVKTIPGRTWFMILRLYYPLESWFNKGWQPGEIVELI
jgi:hypothetical protein